MGKEKLGQDPAFAQSGVWKDGQWIDYGSTGMSKRFYAACCAMQGFTSNPETIIDLSKVAKKANLNVLSIMAKMSFEIADELLKQENE